MKMKDSINKRLFLGFIYLHILHHAKKEHFYGLWMIKELSSHGYDLSPGTLYPILHSLEDDGLIFHYKRNVSGKIRKYYKITKYGEKILKDSKIYLKELVSEIGIELENK